MATGLGRFDVSASDPGKVLVCLDGEETEIISAIHYAVRGIEPAFYELAMLKDGEIPHFGKTPYRRFPL